MSLIRADQLNRSVKSFLQYVTLKIFKVAYYTSCCYCFSGSLSIQTSVQAVVTVIVSVVGVALTITTGGRLASQKLSSPQTMSVVQPVADISHGTGLTREDLPTRINPTDALNNPTRSADIGRTLVELVENENETMISEQTPLLAVRNVRERNDGEDRTDQAFHCPEQGVNSTTAHPEEVEKEDEDDDSGLRVGYCEWGYKVKIGLVTASLFFAFGLVAMFSMTSSDILGKAIYGGDPKAPPGSDSLTKCGAFGYACYIAASHCANYLCSVIFFICLCVRS